jgi:hypothetical protein
MDSAEPVFKLQGYGLLRQKTGKKIASQDNSVGCDQKNTIDYLVISSD